MTVLILPSLRIVACTIIQERSSAFYENMQLDNRWITGKRLTGGIKNQTVDESIASIRMGGQNLIY